MGMKMDEKLLTVEEVAERGHCSKRHVMDEKKRGQLQCLKLGKRLWFPESSVKKWILRKTQVA